MSIKKNEISFNDAINFANHSELLLKRRDNNFLLSDYQINVLTRNGIDYKKYRNIKELMFDIDNYLDEYYDEELDNIGYQLSEYIYYNNTNK